MKKQSIFSLSRHLALVGLSAFTLANMALPSWAADGFIQALQYDAVSHHLTIDASGPVKATVNTINMSNRKRVVIDVDNAEIASNLPLDTQLLQNLSQNLPGLVNLSVNQYSGNGRPIVRIMLELSGDQEPVRLVQNQSARLELELSGADTPTLRVNNSATISARPSSTATYKASASLQKPATAAASTSGLEQKYVALLDENRSLRMRLDVTSKLAAEKTQENVAVAGSNQRAELERLKVINTNLQSQLNGFLTSNDSAMQVQRTTITDLNRQLAEAKRKVDALTLERNGLQMQADINRGNIPVEDMKRTLITMNQRYEEVLSENKSLKSKLASVPAKPTLSSDALTAKQNEIASLKQSVQQLQTQLQQAKLASAQPVGNPELASVKQALATKQSEVASLKQSVQQLQTQLQQAKLASAQPVGNPELASVKQALATKQSEVASLKQSVQQLQTQLQQAKLASAQPVGNPELASVKQALATKQSEVASLKQSVQQLQTQLQQAKLASAQPTTSPELDSLKQDLTALSYKYGQLNAENQNLKAENKELKDRPATPVAAASPDAGLKTLKTQLTIAQQSLNDAVSTINEQNKEIAALKNQMGSANTNSDTQAQISALKEQLAQAQAGKNSGNDQLLETLKNEVSSLTVENQSLKARQNQSADVSALQSELASLKAQKETALAEARNAKQELDSQKKVMMATKPVTGVGGLANQKQVADLNRQLADLRKENATLRDSSTSTRSAVSNPEAEKNYTEAKAALAAGNLAGALDKYKMAQLLDPDNSKYTVDYSVALTQNHEYAESAELLRRYLARNPGDREAYGQLGKVYLLNDQADMALQALARGIPVGTLNNYATALKKQGKSDDAESLFKLALQLNPSDSEVLFNLGNLYNATERLDLARNSYLQAIQLRPDFAEAHYNLGLIYSKLGDRAKAVTHLQKFLDLSPGARNADTIRAYIDKLKV